MSRRRISFGHTLLLLLIHLPSILAQYSINVYKGFRNVENDNLGRLPYEALEVGAEYSLEIKSTDLSEDYLIDSCMVVETGEQFINPAGCLKCTSTFINMIESAGYTLPSYTQKSSIIHFRPNQRWMTFQCTLRIYGRGQAERACDRYVAGTPILGAPLRVVALYWGGGIPWWVWLLIALLILLLICCCCALLAFLLLRRKKRATAIKSVEKVQTFPPAPPIQQLVHPDPKPMLAVSGTQTSNFDKTSLNRIVLDAAQLEESQTRRGDSQHASEIAHERAASHSSHVDTARLASTGQDKVEVFSGHAGVYNVRNGSVHRFEKNPNITRTRHESERLDEYDRHSSYANHAYDPESRISERRAQRSVNCVEGYDEVVRYSTDREINEYDHIERELETSHTTRFFEEETPTYYDRRHHSIPV